MLGLWQMLDPEEGIVFISIPASRPSSLNHNSDRNCLNLAKIHKQMFLNVKTLPFSLQALF